MDDLIGDKRLLLEYATGIFLAKVIPIFAAWKIVSENQGKWQILVIRLLCSLVPIYQNSIINCTNL